MPRRSWRDLDRPDRPASPAAAPTIAAGPGTSAASSSDLDRAAEIAPNSRLSSLLEERRQLEDRLRNLTGLPGQQGTGDARRDAMFQVPSFAERQAEQRQWEAQRQQSYAQQQTQARQRWGSAFRTQSEDVYDPNPASSLGASGLSPGTLPGLAPRAPTAQGPALSERTRAVREDFVQRSRATREQLLGRPREAAEKLDSVGRPLRDIGNQLADQDRQLDEMDRKLAAEGVSDAERKEIRDAVKSDAVDKVAGILGKANKAIEAPKKAVAKIDQFWQQREQQISGSMDRFSGYAADRERRLSTETGGSGDLFERMQANRLSALRRRQESRMQERRDERRRERARERRAERRAEEN